MKFDVYDRVRTKDGKFHTVTKKIPAGTRHLNHFVSEVENYDRYCLDYEDTFLVSDNDISIVYELHMLRPGMAIKTKDGRFGVIEVRENCENEDYIKNLNVILFENGGVVSIEENKDTHSKGYGEDLCHKVNHDFDISEIYSYQSFGTNLNKRFSDYNRRLLHTVEEVKELTLEELMSEYHELTGTNVKLKDVPTPPIISNLCNSCDKFKGQELPF